MINNNPSRYLVPTSISAIIAWLSFLLVVIKVDPYISTQIALTLFFLTLFFALTSTLTIAGFYIRRRVSNNEVLHNFISISLRQAILLSLCTIGCLFFLFLGVLTWWDGLLLVLIVTLVEFYFSSND